MGTFVSSQGKKFHQPCFSQDVACAGCGQMAFGETLQACGKTWHAKCFKCNRCHASLGNDFLEKGGYPFCKVCISQAPSSTRVVKTVTGTTGNVSADIFANVQKGKLFCAECGQVISANEAVGHGESVFHPQCFRCSKCGKQLSAESGFRMIDGAPSCASCSGPGGGSGFCAGCGKKLVGQYQSAMGEKWHKECFVCTACAKPFNGGYAEKDGKPFCGDCVQKQQPAASSGTQYTGTRTGFTVDPRTGQKKYTVGGPK